MPRVLVIEDEPDIASAIEKLLKKHFQARVERAPSAETARRRLAASTFDVVTLDYQLPDGDGLTILREIVSVPGAPPVIMVTGHGDEDIASDALRFGASGYVQKDRRITALLVEAVRKALLASRLKKAEEELFETRDYLESLLEYANAPIIVWDPQLKITRFNRALERLSGHRSSQVIGKNLSMLFPPGTRSAALEEISRTAEGEYWETVEIPILREDGQVRIAVWNSANIYDKDTDALVATIAQGQDITDRKVAEEELRRYQADLEKLVADRTEELARAIRRQDAANKVLSESLTCQSVEEVGNVCLAAAEGLTSSNLGFIGLITSEGKFGDIAISDVDWKDDVRHETKRYEMIVDMEIGGYWGRVLSQGTPVLLNDPSADPDSRGVPEGHIAITSFLGVPLVRNGDTVGMIAQANNTDGYTHEQMEDLQALSSVFIEALDRKRLELVLLEHHERTVDLIEERTGELRVLNEELDAYARMVSHDLKSPLSAINLSAALMKDSLALVEDDQVKNDLLESVDTIRRNLSRTYSLVNGLLNLAEAGHVPQDVERVDVNAVVGEIIEERAGYLRETGTRVEIGSDLGTVRANALHVYQVFGNIIGNAIRHGDAAEPMVVVRMKGTDAAGDNLYEVCDNGSGIPAEDLDGVFKPFYKGRNSSDTGIGLSIAKKIVEVYGGTIKAYNDHGACLEFTLRDWESADQP